jgi:hypothetical protein
MPTFHLAEDALADEQLTHTPAAEPVRERLLPRAFAEVPSRHGRAWWAVLSVIIVVIMAGGVAGGILLTRGHRVTPVSLPSKRAATGNPATITQLPLSGTPSIGSSPTSSIGSGPVSVAAGLTGNPEIATVGTLLDDYFTAINNHNYSSYISLLTPAKQQDLTAQQFDSGYATTVDSGETLVSISSQANGDAVAVVTFISHQAPADSANHKESCTNWDISLFLVPDSSGGFLIGEPTSRYRATNSACP